MPKLAVTDGTGKRVPILARVTPTVREDLEAAAGVSGRSLSLEIETRLQASFDQDEIKAEMRGTIAALEERLASMKEREAALWPDEATRLLGKAFSMALETAQHVFGTSWRESPAVVEIVAGVVRQVMIEHARPVGLFASLAPVDERVKPAVTAIARSLSDYLAGKMPLLLEADRDNAALVHRARMVTTFRDHTTREVLRIATGPEFDPTNPGDRPQQGPEVRAAMDYFRPRRDSVDIEVSLSYAMEDGTSVWEVLDKVQSEEPAALLVGQPEATRLMADTKPAPGQDSGVFDEALFAETMGPERSDDDIPPPAPAEPQAAPKRRGRAKAPA